MKGGWGEKGKGGRTQGGQGRGEGGLPQAVAAPSLPFLTMEAVVPQWSHHNKARPDRPSRSIYLGFRKLLICSIYCGREILTVLGDGQRNITRGIDRSLKKEKISQLLLISCGMHNTISLRTKKSIKTPRNLNVLENFQFIFLILTCLRGKTWCFEIHIEMITMV